MSPDLSREVRSQQLKQLDDSLGHSSGSRHAGLVMMLVGGAGVVAGLIADEDVLTILGAGVGGVGLYLYVR